MPKIYLPLPETDTSVVRPIVFDIVRGLLEITQIPESTPIYYKGQTSTIAQKGSTLQSGDTRDNTKLASNSFVTIEVTETYMEDALSSTAISQYEHPPIFHDHSLRISIKPIYIHNEYTVTFRYQDKSKIQAQRWRNDIRMKISHLRDINIHTATYHFVMPLEIMRLLQEIYKHREAVEPYNQTFNTYFDSFATTKFTTVSNLDGSSQVQAVKETQTRIQGIFDFVSGPDEPALDTESQTYVSEITYKFWFDKPIGCHISYPVMIHNQLIDTSFIPRDGEDLEKHDMLYSHSLNALHHMENMEIMKRADYDFKVVNIPPYDDFAPDNYPPDTVPLCHALCQIDPNDKKYVLDLNDLGEYEIDPDIMVLMKDQEFTFMTKPYQSLFQFSLYRWQHLTDDKQVFIDSNLKLYSKEPLDLRTNHYVRFSLVSDLNVLPVPALKRLRSHPKAMVKVFNALRVNKGQLMRLVRKVDLLKYFPNLPDVGYSRLDIDNAHVGFNTVMTSFVLARKRSEYKE